MTLILIAIFLMAFAGCNNTANKMASANAADAIYYGGDIITMDGDSAAYAGAVAIKEGKIIFALFLYYKKRLSNILKLISNNKLQ